MGNLVEDLAGIIIASADQLAARLARIGDGGTAGPAEHPPELVDVPHPPAPRWTDGWWTGAIRKPAHPARVGGPIAPCVCVDHCTDMHPDDWPALIASWTGRAGEYACAHFVVGRTEQHGANQFVPITKNGNHAGGKTPPNGHGWFVDPAHPGQLIHPNLIAVGIEFHCAGGMLRRIDGKWMFVEDGVIHGAPIPDEDVEPDPQRPGRGWHKLTAYQERIRAELHADLDAAMHPMPAGLRAVSTGETVPTWGVPKSVRFLGHVTLDPTNRSDPWPNGMRAIS